MSHLVPHTRPCFSPSRLAWTLLAFVLVLCLWFPMRLVLLRNTQAPPNPIMHAGYSTYHEMSQSIDEGGAPGQINISRMQRFITAGIYSNYDPAVQPDDMICNYQTLDSGYGYVVWVARKAFFFLKDNHLRTLALQEFVDLMLLIVVFATFVWRGVIPGAVAGALYAMNEVFAYNAALTFYYFWDGVVAMVALLLVLWGHRLAPDKGWRVSPIVCAVLLGLCLGAGTWLRASWVPLSFSLFVCLLVSSRWRKLLPIALVCFMILFVPEVQRATEANGGKFATSTRMIWHTAHQALGKYPNLHGLEDDDLYQFDVAEKKYGVKYNYCSYQMQDEAMRQEFAYRFNQDPAFVVRSIASRIYTNVIRNNNENYWPFWNKWFLTIAVAGFFWCLRRGGELMVLGLSSAAIFWGSSVLIGIVYYVNPNYAFVPQIALLMLAVGVADMLAFLMRRAWCFIRKDNSSFEKLPPLAPLQKKSLIGFGILSLLVVGAVYIPAVEKYLLPEMAIDMSYSYPAELTDVQLDELIQGWQDLPQSEQQTFMRRYHLADEARVRAWLMANLNAISFTARDKGVVRTFYFNKDLAKEVYEGVRRASLFVTGWQSEKVTGFNWQDRESWSGRRLIIKLNPETAKTNPNFWPLVEEKFKRWGWKITYTEDGKIIGMPADSPAAAK